jgi:divalent metal cation (Fe/Co/Zn/Cd) transporter
MDLVYDIVNFLLAVLSGGFLIISAMFIGMSIFHRNLNSLERGQSFLMGLVMIIVAIIMHWVIGL